jgi:hypothetical protein
VTSSLILQFFILLGAMSASALIGFWVARRHFDGAATMVNDEWNKVAQTIEQLRERAMLAEAEKARIEHQSEQEREEVRAWYRAHGYPAE